MTKKFLLLASILGGFYTASSQVSFTSGDVKATLGTRFMADAVYYADDKAEIPSGTKITEARVRVGFKVDQWDAYADFDFTSPTGANRTRDLWVRYTFKNEEGVYKALRFGYQWEPFGMTTNTGRMAYHFIQRPNYHNALGGGRLLGLTYYYANPKFFTHTGIFSERPYNDQNSGNSGIVLSGRYIYKPIADENSTLQIGTSQRFAIINTYKTASYTLSVSSPLETNVLPSANKIGAIINILDPKNSYRFGVESMYHNSDFFIRGEYMKTFVNKKTSGTAEYQSAYVETGYTFNGSYKYDNQKAVLKGLNKAGNVEAVARVSWTDLYSGINTNGVSGGVQMRSYTLGANYVINKYAQLMLSYTYTNLTSKTKNDKNIGTLQARAMFNF